MSGPDTLVIACGAIATELVEVLDRNRFDRVKVKCLPAEWHNRPERIAPAIKELLEEYRAHYRQIFVAYADCGTGGALDAVLRDYDDIQRLPGDHCYSFFAGSERFEALAAEEIGTFYLTDYLARNFERLIINGLGIDRHPQLMDAYFGHYTRIVYLAQSRPPARLVEARAAAERLGLPLETIVTGLEPFASVIPLREMANA